MAPISLTLTGLTNDGHDQSVDLFRTVTLPLLARFGLEEGLEFKIVGRGAPPEGGGQVTLLCPVVRKLKPLRVVSVEKVKRIRGIAYSTRVAPTMSNRIVEGAKGVLSVLTQDVFIYTDHYKGEQSGKSPGYACALVAETTDGCLTGTDCTAKSGGDLPEDVGSAAALQLLHELSLGGCVDRTNQWLALVLMALGPSDVSKLRFGTELTEAAMEAMRLIKDFFGVVFKIERDVQHEGTILVSCVGSGSLLVCTPRACMRGEGV
jgi:RNA 3'-terminal phosphate cyclase-like protein